MSTERASLLVCYTGKMRIRIGGDFKGLERYARLEFQIAIEGLRHRLQRFCKHDTDYAANGATQQQIQHKVEL